MAARTERSQRARRSHDAKLQTRFTVLFSAVIVVAAAVYLVWSHASQTEAVNSKVLAEARTLGVEMAAVWDYIDAQQDVINYNSDGRYDFKGVYCSVAGKAIARRFTMRSDGYAVHYVRDDPRTPTDEPDDFERRALDAIYAGATEYYGRDVYQGQEVFRYVEALTYTYGCLQCHGAPAGEPDETNYPKEGMGLGDVAGAVSIIIPLDTYQQEATSGLVRSVVFFGVLTLVAVLLLRWALRRWVTAPLEDANLRLREDNEAKSDFLAVMSHELRTPLSSIIAFTDIWDRRSRSKGPDAVDPDDARLVGEIRENSRVLLDMVNNTIDAEKIEQGRFQLTMDEVDLVDVADTVCTVIEPLAQKQGVLLRCELDPATPIITSDWNALNKIAMNLVGNAVKFTSAGGTVTMGSKVLGDGSQVELFVTDTGRGIEEAELESIFGKYSQSVFRTASDQQGSGLGLYLVKTLAEKLGGSVRVQSEIDRGSTFTVTLPVAGPQAAGKEED